MNDEMMNNRNLGQITPRSLEKINHVRSSSAIEIGPTGKPLGDIENNNNGNKLIEASPTRLV